MSEQDKVSLEVAEAEFARFLDEMDIDGDTEQMDEDDLAQFKKCKAKVIKAIRRGSLVINDSGEAVYTPVSPKSRTSDTLTFHERTGASMMAADGKKKNHNVAQTYAIMADLCKVHPGVIAGLVGTDIKTCEALYALLMD